MELLKEYDTLFQPTSSLPSQRPTDHRIPLVEGANPVNVQPYRKTGY